MKDGDPNIDAVQLQMAFQGRRSIEKTELRAFLRQRVLGLTEQGFRRVLYDLERREILIPLGTGFYGFSTPARLEQNQIRKAHPRSSNGLTKAVQHRSRLASNRSIVQVVTVCPPGKFVPMLSPAVGALNGLMRESFPYADYLIWETRTIHEFMNLQPGQAQIVVEIEKDAREPVFNMLSDRYSSDRVYLEPDHILMERYVLRQPESLIVLRLITQSPKLVVGGTPTARLEKILVDLFADRQRFFMFQGGELVTIFENVFDRYWINPKTLNRYAGRRKVSEPLLDFIRSQTTIHFGA
jgi:hypothetical protein